MSCFQKQIMPQISYFLGIVIRMYFMDHNPPHFHAVYGNYEALINIQKLELMGGSLPPRVLGLVIEWAALNEKNLLLNWERAKNGESLLPIDPLVWFPDTSFTSKKSALLVEWLLLYYSILKHERWNY